MLSYFSYYYNSFKWPCSKRQQNTINTIQWKASIKPCNGPWKFGEVGNSHINTSKLIWRGFNWSVGCQRKTSACKLQVVACSLPFFFWKIEWRDIILVFYVCIYLLFPNLTMYSVPYFTQLSFVWIIFQKGKIFISGRLSLVP